MESNEELQVENINEVVFEYWETFGVLNDELNRGSKWHFEIFPSGEVSFESYPRNSKTVINSEKVIISQAQVKDFYKNLLSLFLPDKILFQTMVCDGCSYELVITYNDGRVKNFEGDVGGGDIDNTVMNFLSSIPEMKDKVI